MNKVALVRELVDSGLSEKEAILYIAAVQKHIFTLAEIAKISGLKRTTCYSIVESLLVKNYIALVPDSRLKRYIAVDPTAIAEREHSKIKSLDQAMQFMGQIRNTLAGQDIPHIELFYGSESGKNIFNIILKDSPEVLYGIVNPEYIKKCLGVDFTEKWIRDRVKKNIKRYDLQQMKYETFGFQESKSGLKRETKILPDDFDHESTIQIWNNKVGFISDKKEGISFIVSSNEFSKVMTGIFKSLWNISKSREDFLE